MKHIYLLDKFHSLVIFQHRGGGGGLLRCMCTIFVKVHNFFSSQSAHPKIILKSYCRCCTESCIDGDDVIFNWIQVLPCQNWIYVLPIIIVVVVVVVVVVIIIISLTSIFFQYKSRVWTAAFPTALGIDNQPFTKFWDFPYSHR